MECTICKTENQNDAIFCEHCGKKLPNPKPLQQKSTQKGNLRIINFSSFEEPVSLAAIEEMSDDRYIREIAMATKYKSVCLAAIEELADDRYIREIEQKLNSQ